MSRIVILSAAYPGAQHPVNGVFVQDQAECLAAAGHEVAVLVPQASTPASLAHWLAAPPRVDVQRGVTRYFLPKCYIPSLLRSLAWPQVLSPLLRYALMCRAGYARGLAAYMRRHGRPDVLHAHNLFPSGWAAASLGRRHGIPVVVTEHSSALPAQLAHPMHLRQAARLLPHLHALLAVSPAQADILKQWLPHAQPLLVPNVIRDSQFIPGNAAGGIFRFFCLCLHVPGKGVNHLIEAALQLRAQGQDFELVIGGDGPSRTQWEKLAAPLGGACRFTGLLTREQAVAQMQACSAFVLPSLGETFGIVLGEAMACGKPVIATRCGGPEYIIEEGTGLLVPPADSAALAAAMARLLHGEFRADAAWLRRQAVARFGEAALCQRLGAVYDAVPCSR